jgi:DNA polymerase-3 subunit gamma/tau
VPADRYVRLAAQAEKFTPAELSRILTLLVVAQTDMRWTTSPRLTLELALVRATVPEADPSPAGLAARIARLERLAGVVEGTDASVAGDTGRSPSRAEHPHVQAASPLPSEQEQPPAPVEAPEQPAEEIASESPTPVSPAPHAPSAESLDLATIRRSWQQLLDRLSDLRQMILHANLQSATAASYDGTTLELAFPPGRKFSVEKVQSKEGELRQAFADVFGVSPRIRCVARESVVGVVIEEEEPPSSREDAVARLRAQFGDEVEEDGG